jgi:hypothetical protein
VKNTARPDAASNRPPPIFFGMPCIQPDRWEKQGRQNGDAGNRSGVSDPNIILHPVAIPVVTEHPAFALAAESAGTVPAQSTNANSFEFISTSPIEASAWRRGDVDAAASIGEDAGSA